MTEGIFRTELQLTDLPRTQKRAEELGLMWFYTARKCARGHLSKRHTKGGTCYECVREKRGAIGTNRRRAPASIEAANAAIEDGIATFSSEKACKHGHFERFAMSGNCVQCNKDAIQRRRDKLRDCRIQRIYGLSQDDYEKMLNGQDGKCAICKSHHTEVNKMHIDHDHNTNKVRAILCGKCNQAIGLLNHSVEIMASAIRYIEGHAS